jgi:threonine dehydrogenase-like Zn-dependent dehydrogenase
MTPLELDAVVKGIESPILASVRKYKDKVYDFVLIGKKRTWDIRLNFSYGFPYRFPSATLLNKELIGTLPHVNFEGTICVEENDTVLIDYDRPLDILTCFLKDIVDLLNMASLKINIDELTDEYEGYFQSSVSSINAFYCAGESVENINLRIAYKDNFRLRHVEPVFLYGNKGSVPQQFSNIKGLNKLQTIKILHIPLIQSVLPPAGKSPITPAYAKKLYSNISDENQVKVKKLTEQNKMKKEYFILFSMPRNTGERTQILLRFISDKALDHPYLIQDNSWNIKTYLLNRNNKSYIKERGGAESSLSSKKVSIIGCGSVGGEIAVMLAKAGVGELTLIDYDRLEPDNIYRHRLGGTSLNYVPKDKSTVVKATLKVIRLAHLLKSELPYIKINPKPCLYNDIVNDSDFLKSDVIIVAVGSPTLNLQINNSLRLIGMNKAIFCWNEAAGIGGHTASLDLTKSCLECLYTHEARFTLACSLNLLELGQTISKNLTGCAGVFTPFSYLDSSKTANLASSQCVDMLLHNTHSKAVSWKGHNKSGYLTTVRFNNMAMMESSDIETKEGCRTCNE